MRDKQTPTLMTNWPRTLSVTQTRGKHTHTHTHTYNTNTQLWQKKKHMYVYIFDILRHEATSTMSIRTKCIYVRMSKKSALWQLVALARDQNRRVNMK